MKARKVIAVILLAFFLITISFGMTIAVASLNTISSEDFYSDYLGEAVSELPRFIDISIELIREKRIESDGDDRIWLEAIEKADLDFTRIVVESGISDWMEQELKAKIRMVGEMMSGKIPVRPMNIEMRGLKEILRGEYIANALKSVLLNLPDGSGAGAADWQNYLERHGGEMPPVRPSETEIDKIVAHFQDSIDSDLEDEIQVIEGVSDIRVRNLGKLISGMGYFLFIIPALFLILAAFIACHDAASFWKWTAVPLIISGAISFLFAILIRNVLTLSNFVSFSGRTPDHYLEFVFLNSFEKIFLGGAVSYLFREMQKLSTVIIFVGLLLLAIAVIFSKKSPRPETGR